MADSLAYPAVQPGDDPDDVLFGSIYGVRTVELNRPKKLNSLNGSMARKIMARLKVGRRLQVPPHQAGLIIWCLGVGKVRPCVGSHHVWRRRQSFLCWRRCGSFS